MEKMRAVMVKGRQEGERRKPGRPVGTFKRPLKDSDWEFIENNIKTKTIKEIAEALGTTPSTVYNYIKYRCGVEGREAILNERRKFARERYITLWRLCEMTGTSTNARFLEEVRKNYIEGKMLRFNRLDASKVPEIIDRYWMAMDWERAADGECAEMIKEKQKGWVRLSDIYKTLKGRLSRQGLYNIIKRDNLKTVRFGKHTWVYLPPDGDPKSILLRRRDIPQYGGFVDPMYW